MLTDRQAGPFWGGAERTGAGDRVRVKWSKPGHHPWFRIDAASDGHCVPAAAHPRRPLSPSQEIKPLARRFHVPSFIGWQLARKRSNR